MSIFCLILFTEQVIAPNGATVRGSVFKIEFRTLSREFETRLEEICQMTKGPVHLSWDILPLQKKSPIDEMGKNIWGKLMVFFPIRSIYLNGTN